MKRKKVFFQSWVLKSSSASHGEVVSLGVTYAMNEIIPFKERERERERERESLVCLRMPP